jgi:putative transposase
LVREAQNAGARQSAAGKIVGINVKTLQRWKKPGNEKDGRSDSLRQPANKLTDEERRLIIAIISLLAYANLSASKIVPKLGGEGLYIASESTFYRVMKEHKLMKHRLKSTPAREIKKPRALIATGPNQVYSGDITYLHTDVKGIFLYLYLVMDVFSRKIVGWQVYEQESSALAADLMVDICNQEGIAHGQVTLHSDNGSPMKGATMVATLNKLGITPSLSRPSVSNDNPYSESLFRTFKYRPDHPDKLFENIGSAREWVQTFVYWYNKEHLHSSIKFVTPDQRHNGEDRLILANRKQVYLEAKKKNPDR